MGKGPSWTASVGKDELILMAKIRRSAQELTADTDTAMLKDALQKNCPILKCPFHGLLDHL